MRLVLIFNPASGGGRSDRAKQAETVARRLRELGHEVELVRTRAAGSAAAQAREAAVSGAEIVFACGGDGTAHEVAQGLAAEEGGPSVALGILPMGSENALARHLKLSLDPVEAALQQLGRRPALVPAGKVECGGESRYFLALAGAGPDGALVYDLADGHKWTLGRWAYSWHAARLFVTRRFPGFEVQYREAESGKLISQRAVCAMAVRVASLGGLFGGLAGPAASFDESGIRLLLVKPPGWVSLPVWFLTGWLGCLQANPMIRFVQTSEFTCLPRGKTPTHVEADGEWVGRLPMRVSSVQDALRLLLPEPLEPSAGDWSKI